MRILKIRAQNFLSHVDTVLDLKGIDSYVVLGNNGSGKSSLVVDVPLVALFGQGRCDMDDYVKLGKDSMLAEVEFALDTGHYRVTRKRSKKTARGSSLLEFYQIDTDGTILNELTLGTIAETQILIEKTIGIDYDTLIKTSVIEQTEAEKFCLALPSERMDLLASIWDLQKYDDLGQIAKEERIGVETTIKVSDQKIGDLTIKIQEAGAKRTELETLKKDSARIDENLKKAEAKKEKLQKELAKLESTAKEISTLEISITKTESEIQEIAKVHEDILKKITRFDKILNNQETVRQKVIEEGEKSQALSGAESGLKEIEQATEALRQKIESIRKEHQSRIDEIEIETHTIDVEITETRKKETAVQKGVTELSRREEQLKHLCFDADKLQGIACHPDYDLGYINDSCRFIRDAAVAKKRIPELQAEIATEKEQIDAEMATLKAALGALQEKRSTSVALAGEIKKSLSQAIVAIEAQISDKKTALDRKRSEIEGIKTTLAEIRKYTILLPEIDLAEKELPGLKEEERSQSKKAMQLVTEKANLLKEKEVLQNKLMDKPGLEASLRDALKALAVDQGTREDLIKKIGAIEQMVGQIEPMKEEIKQIEAETEKLTTDKALLMMLEEAYKAIPFMIISQGIGSVENKANQILSEISQNDLRVKVETAKVTKTTKKIRDEINLVITDRDGEKKYKMLSGGERLRVAMALRLAISEVLAHRRSVRIESLIADEPFGPLDVGGVEDMKECLRNLKSRFKVMGVVTHDERAKDLFPVQIEVSRGKNGAEVRIVGE